jgi:hypothetical protein
MVLLLMVLTVWFGAQVAGQYSQNADVSSQVIVADYPVPCPYC